MHTTNQLLDAIAEKHGNATNYRLSKLFATNQQTVGHWRKGRSIMSPEFATKAAALLDWDPAYVVACVEHERAMRGDPLERTGDVLATWERIADRFRPAIPSILLGFVALFGAMHSPQAQAVTATSEKTSSFTAVYIMRGGMRRLRRWLATVFPAIDVRATLAGAA